MTEIVDFEQGTVLLGGGGEGHAVPQVLLLKYANRHGLIAGATGTGKTVTLQTLAESFSRAGVPVFLADVKGDLAGLGKPGGGDASLAEAFARRAAQIGATLHITSQRHKGTTVAIGARGSPSRGAHDPPTPARVPTDWMALRPLGRRTGVG